MGEEGLSDRMVEVKRTMEQDCEKLKLNLEDLMSDRASVLLEFKHLKHLQHDLLIQLKGDTLAGEGQLHSFQVEKKRVEDRLDQLENQIREKNLTLAELDAKASEYLLKVTTASNTLYGDDDENSEDNQEDRDLIKQLVYDEMTENEFDGALKEGPTLDSSEEEEEEEMGLSDGDSKLRSFSPEPNTSEICDDEASLSFDKSNPMDESHIEDIPYDPPPTPPMSGPTSPAHNQMLTLTSLLDELKGVKEELGRFVTLKDSSVLEIEHELQDTKSELSHLKDSMQNLVKEISTSGRESPMFTKRDIDIKRSLPDISELHEIKEICTIIKEEKKDLVSEIGSLKDTMTEMRRDQSQSLDRRSQSHSGELNLGSFLSPAVVRRSSSTCSISGTVALLEKELADTRDKLNESALHMKLLVTEREHKQRECELLQKKVTTVESKMHELQTTFDTLMNSIMTERDELVQKLKEKDEALLAAKMAEDYKKAVIEAQTQLASLKLQLESVHAGYDSKIRALEDENSALSEERDYLKLLDEEWRKKISTMYSESQLEEVKIDLRQKDALVKTLQEKLFNFEVERVDFAAALKGEMERLKEEAAKAKEDKEKVETVFNALQEEQKETQEKHFKLLDRFNALTKDSNKKTSLLESMEKSTEALEKQVEELSSKTENMTSERQERECELEDELTARAATIQELRVTITNNQKQSKENYQLLQDDMSVLQTRLSKEREEYDAVVAHLKNKCAKLTDDYQQIQQEKDSMKNNLEEAEKKLTEIEQASKANEENANQTEDSVDDVTQTEERPAEAKTTEGNPDAGLPRGENEEACKDEETGGTSEALDDAAKAFNDEEEFRKMISAKESLIEELESKVNELESTIINKNSLVAQLEEKLSDYNKKEAENTEAKSRLEEQLMQIEKLNKNLDELKNELDEISREKSSLQQAIGEVQGQRKVLEDEKKSLVTDYETKLSEMQDSLDNLESEAEVKKNLAEELDLKLSSIESRIVDGSSCSSSGSSSSSFVDRVANLGTHYESKLKETNDHFQSTVNTLGVELKAVRSEKESYKTKAAESGKTIKALESENVTLSQENKKIISENAEKQDKYIEMQNQMVSDLESLILNLEKDKKKLENEIDSLKKDLTRVAEERRKILAALEASLNRIREEKIALQKGEDIDLHQSYTDDPPRETLLEKLNEVTSQLELKEREFEDHIKRNGEAHSSEMSQLRKDMREEIDILEQQKEEMKQEHERKISLMAAQYTSEMLEEDRQEEIKLLDEKAQFGRVLVAKNDEYEKLKEERMIEAEGYQARIQDLQLQLEEKTNLVEELEVNIGELIGVRANLEEKLESLKVPPCKEASTPDDERSRRSPSNSAGMSTIPAPLFATNVKPPMQN